MIVLLRLLLLWIALTLSSHSLLSHYWQGRVAQQTLALGAEAHTLRFYGFLCTFGISVYYFWKEMGEWRAEMLAKVMVGALSVVLFLASQSGLESMDQSAYIEMAEYQMHLISSGRKIESDNLRESLEASVPLGATPEVIVDLLPGVLPKEKVDRRDGTSYQDFYYWMGTGMLPLGVHISYSAPPARVERVEAVPRERPNAASPPQALPFQPGKGDPASDTDTPQNP